MMRAIFLERDLHTVRKFGRVEHGRKSWDLIDDHWMTKFMPGDPPPPCPTVTTFVRALVVAWNSIGEYICVFVPADTVPLKPEQVDPLLARVKALYDPPGA